MTTRAARKSHGKHGKWTSADMVLAINAVQSGSGLNAAARSYSVPKATLKRHLDGTNKNACGGVKHLGRNIDIPLELEEQLAKHVLDMEAMFYGFSKVSLCKLAFQIAEINMIPHRFSKGKMAAGKEWLSGFLKRHPEISVRIPQATSLARCSGFNRPRVNAFFDLLEQLVEKHGLTADRIYNTDEKGLTAVQKPGKVLAKKGKPQVGSITSAEKGQNVTFVCCMSASGHFIPPMVIFPRKRMNPLLQEGAPPGSIFKCQENGWMTVDLFTEWIEHFIQFVKPDQQKPVLLILDGHVSHTHNLKALEMARAAGVILLSLPSHTTHRMQPLDVAFFRPLSIYYGQNADKWMRQNAARPLTIYQICKLFGEAFGKAASLETAMSGFRKAGIWPVDRNVFHDSDFAPSQATHIDITNNTGESNNVSVNDEQVILDTAMTYTFHDGTSIVNDTLSQIVVEYVAPNDEQGQGEIGKTLGELPDPSSISLRLVAMTNDDIQKALSENVSAELPELSTTSGNKQWLPIEQISPLPSRTRERRKRKGNTLEATILTGSPYKSIVENRLSSKQSKTVNAPAKKQVVSSRRGKKKSKVINVTGTEEPHHSLQTLYRCLVCGESYDEGWIQCKTCHGWAHEDCADLSDSLYYFCDNCKARKPSKRRIARPLSI